MGRLALTQDDTTETELEQGSELDFQEGIEVGQEIELDRVADVLENEGFNPAEIDEMLYDPAPRKRKKGRGRKGKRRSYDPMPRRRYGRGRRYDPAPKRKSYRKRAKGALGKLRKWALPGSAGLTFFAAYSKRAKDLNMSLMDAIMHDVKNFDASAAMKRVQGQVGEIAAPLIAGWAVKETHVLGKYSGIAGEILSGLGLGVAGKAILDPPGRSGAAAAPTRSKVVVVEGNGSPVAQKQMGHSTTDPYKAV